MAKLYFRYGAMNSGKSTELLQTAYNYEERGHRVILAKSTIDTKDDLRVVSRLGVSREAHLLIAPETDVFDTFQGLRERTPAGGADVSCLLIDEAQFLTEEQVDDLLRIVILEAIPVIAFGIRTDFQTFAFPGSRRLLEVAHSIEELKTICRCGRKAIFNARMVGGAFTFDGDQVAIDGEQVEYEALCGSCYLRESNGVLLGGERQWPVTALPYDQGPDADFM